MKVSLFNIANFKVDGGAMFGVIPKALWSRVYPSDENNLITLCLNSLLVETGGRVILTDAGWGDKQDEKFFRHVYLHGGEGLLEGIARCGYSAADITDVVLTHLHADHCGGCLRNGTQGNKVEHVFPNARYHVSKTQWEWAVKNNIREADAFLPENILPLADDGRLHLVEKDEVLFPGFEVRLFFGHTPGLMIPLVRYMDQTLVYTGDLIPTTAHIPLIWNMSYDIEQLKTISEKETILKEALDKDYALVFQHDTSSECCKLEMTPKGIRAGRRFGFSELGS